MFAIPPFFQWSSKGRAGTDQHYLLQVLLFVNVYRASVESMESKYSQCVLQKYSSSLLYVCDATELSSTATCFKCVQKYSQCVSKNRHSQLCITLCALSYSDGTKMPTVRCVQGLESHHHRCSCAHFPHRNDIWEILSRVVLLVVFQWTDIGV